MLIAIALLTLTVSAQHKNDRKEHLKDLSPEEIATLKTKKMTLHLDLTEAQQTAVKSLVLEEAKHRESLRAKREEQKNDENFKKPSKEERLAMANEHLDRQIAMKKKMKDILNDQQYEKWEASMEKQNKMKQKRHENQKSQKKQ